MKLALPLSLLALLALAGCSTNEAPAEPVAPTPAEAVKVTTTPAPEAADAHAGHAHGPGEGHEGETSGPAPAAPFAGGGAADAPLTPTPDLDKKIDDAEKGKDKKALAAAYAARGTFRMNDEKAGAKVKYRAALEDYRKALAVDEGNEEASKNKAMIESIYQSMGRPIPGEEESGAKK